MTQEKQQDRVSVEAFKALPETKLPNELIDTDNARADD